MTAKVECRYPGRKLASLKPIDRLIETTCGEVKLSVTYILHHPLTAELDPASPLDTASLVADKRHPHQRSRITDTDEFTQLINRVEINANGKRKACQGILEWLS